MDFKRVKEWFETVHGAVTAAVTTFGALTLVWATATKALDAFIVKTLGLPAWTAHVAVILVGLALVGSVWRSFRGFARASRIERFDAFTLRPITPEALIGRAKDLDGLLNAVKRSRLVLLDGESGCGKSALVTAGLLPRLQQVDSLLPVVIRDWGEDWARGPLTAALDALHHGVSQPDRDRLGWTSSPDLAADTSGLVAQLDARMQRVVDTLGRRPLLIADQFDDYQAGHRQRFLDEEANWLSPTAVAKTNPFWELVSNGLSEGRLHVVIVSRADTAAGLACVRFLGEDQTAVRTLPRVDVEYLRQLLASIAPDDAQPVIVSHPAGGWDALRDLLERDLKPEGAILMQQVRAVLLGLRQLKVLTPARYRTAGGLRGVETLFIERALERAGRALSGGETGLRRARAVLGALVLPSGPNQAPKAQRATRFELSARAGDASCADAVLAVLQQEEVVRPAETIGDAHAWQLDHDYLARAVVAEARQADRWAVELREGKARHDTAYGLRSRWASLLSASKLARICWERVRGRLTFGDAAGYARLSAVRPALVTLIVTLAGVGAYHWNLERALTQEALRIVDRFGGGSADEAVLTVWRAPEPLRMRVYELVRADPGRLERAVRDGWPLAHAGFEPARVREAAELLRERIARDAPRDDERFVRPRGKASFTEYKAIVARMNAVVDVKAEIAALRARLEQLPEQRGSDNFSLLVSAYVTALARLEEPADVNAEVDLLRTLIEHENDARILGRLLSAYGASLRRLSDVDALKTAAAWLRKRLQSERDASLVWQLASIYASGPARVDDANGLRDVAAILRARLGPKRSWSLAAEDPYSEIVARLDEASILAEAVALRDRLAREHDPKITAPLLMAYADISGRLHDTAELTIAARTLLTQIQRDDIWVFDRLVKAYATVALRLGDAAELRAGATALRARWKEAEYRPYVDEFFATYASIAAALSDAPKVRAAARAERARLARMAQSGPSGSELSKPYSTIATWLTEADAAEEARELRTQLAAAPEYGQPSTAMLAAAYEAVAARLNEADAKVEAGAWVVRMEQSHMDFVSSSSPSPYANAYAAAVARLSADGVRAEAAALRARLENERNGTITRRLADAYATIAPTLRDPKTSEVDATVLRSRIEREAPTLTAGIATAYAAAVVQSDKTKASTGTALLGSVLQKQSEKAKGWADPEVVSAYAAIASRLTDADGAQVAAVVLRPLLEPKQPFDFTDFDRRAQAYVSVAAHLRPADLKAEAQALRARLELTLSPSEYQRGPTGLVKAYGAVAAVMVEHAEANERSALVREILTLAGQPLLDDVTPLLAALRPAAGRDFGANTGDAVRWAEQTYGIKPEQLRPPPLDR